MAQSDDRGPDAPSAADEHFRAYERLVGGWIDIFLESQRSIICQSPVADDANTAGKAPRQEADLDRNGISA